MLNHIVLDIPSIGMGDYEKEQKRLQQLWEEVNDDDPISSESEADDDKLSVNSDYPDIEQEADETEETNNVQLTEDVRSNNEAIPEQLFDNNESTIERKQSYFTGKDGTKWKKTCPARNVRTRAENIIIRLPCVRTYAKNAKSARECFLLFIDEQMISDIVKCTNQKILNKSKDWKDSSYYQETSVMEMKAFFGLLFLSGVFKSNHRTLKELWCTDGTGIDVFRSTMAQRRFEYLLSCLRFDNKDNRDERKKIDKLAAIRAIVDKFNENCQNSYSSGAYLTIDEKLESFRGRCSFRQYMPNKPAKYGLKVHALVDAKTYFLLNMEVYVGQQPEGPFRVSNSPKDIVDRLVAPVSGSNKNITCDNWYTSLELFEILRKRHKLTAVGTIRKNKRQIPLAFLNTRNREIESSLFGFQEDYTLVSYVPKKGKIVLLLSSLHHDDTTEKYDNKELPEIIAFYNSTKGGVDTVDEFSANYSLARNSRRWPLTLFFSLLNTSGINAQIIYQKNNGDKIIPRRIFLKTLGLQLLDEYQKVRMSNPRLSRELRGKILTIREEPSSPPQKKVRLNQSGRCQVCTRKQDRKTKYTCKSCNMFLCLEHANIYCENCPKTVSN